MCFILTCRVLSHFYVTHDSLVQKGVLGMCTCVIDGETERERDLSGAPISLAMLEAGLWLRSGFLVSDPVVRGPLEVVSLCRQWKEVWRGVRTCPE